MPGRNVLAFQEAHAEHNTLSSDDNTEHIVNANEVDMSDQSYSNGIQLEIEIQGFLSIIVLYMYMCH